MTADTLAQADPTTLVESIYRDGNVALPGLLPVQWADRLDEDLKREFTAALSAEGGTAPRGWNRFYFEPYPERLGGFLELITHPTLIALSVRMFGDGYKVVELGCDVPLPGAVDQPWHRDFPMPEETRRGRLTSIAVNASSVDVTSDMGPFQFVPGTHFEPGDDFDGGMFPDEGRYAGYEQRMESRLAKRGSVSVRSGLALHRGSRSSNRSRMRPVAIVGIVSPDDRAVVQRLSDPGDEGTPRLKVSRRFIDGVSEDIRRHLSYEVVADTEGDLPAHFTHHTFEGLKMSEMS
jgi:hypothetical protein